MAKLTSQLTLEYKNLFNACLIRSDKFKEVDKIIKVILDGRSNYERVQSVTNVPWYFTGIVHALESSANFRTHLHNGDPLTARTIQVPSNRPKSGNPPFAWDASACDALRLKQLDAWTDWSIPGILFQFERYNGFGYRVHGVNSPYLWSYSNHYVKGKFVKDGIFSDVAVSKQCGAAVILRRMSERQIAVKGEIDPISQIKALGPQVKFSPKRQSAMAKELQKLS